MTMRTVSFLSFLQTLCASLLFGISGAAAGEHVPPPYIEPGFATRFFLGDEDFRLGLVHFINGNYGLAEQHFQRAVEATPQNGAAWIGLASSYDRLGRFRLSDRAYRQAVRLEGQSYVILNNWGYSYLLRGNVGRAKHLLEEAWELAPSNPTINNNLVVLEAGQRYFLPMPP